MRGGMLRCCVCVSYDARYAYDTVHCLLPDKLSEARTGPRPPKRALNFSAYDTGMRMRMPWRMRMCMRGCVALVCESICPVYTVYAWNMHYCMRAALRNEMSLGRCGV